MGITMKIYPMQYPYGSVYFRKSNPPKEDWERDYAQAAEDGINIFRHWFIWGSIEVAPGVYDWSDYDRQLELAEKYGIKTIIAEITGAVPEWAAARYQELLPLDAGHHHTATEMGVSCATGGFCNGFCLDHEASREMVGEFLERLAERYKDHPGMLGYDVANENFLLTKNICYCEDTILEYQKWLRNKYHDIGTLNQAWFKYSYTDFSQIRPPHRIGFFEESRDWLTFRSDRNQEQIRFKIDRIRKIDRKNLITAHGIASTLSMKTEFACSDWESAQNVQVYGVTWVQSRKGNEPWKQCFGMDVTRSSSGEKPFWHTEAQGGPLWLQPQLYGRTREDGRVPKAEDIRLWNLTSMACGAGGILYTRHRPLMDGPLFGAFAPYDMDGSRTEKSRMASRIAKWANEKEQKELFEADTVKGDIGILFLPESESASYLLSLYGNENLYGSMMSGAYRGFFDNNIQADFVRMEDLETVKALYLPFPVAMSSEHAGRLEDWVKQGGVLISEACPGYFGDRFHVGGAQPGNGLEELFGVEQCRAEFMPDLMEDMTFELMGETVYGGGYLQTYRVVTAEAVSRYKDEVLAAVNSFGKGKAMLIGTHMSLGYEKHGDGMGRGIFKKLLAFAGISQRAEVSDSAVMARVQVHKEAKHRYLWILNTAATDKEADITCKGVGEYDTVYWQGGSVKNTGVDRITVRIKARDGIVLRF